MSFVLLHSKWNKLFLHVDTKYIYSSFCHLHFCKIITVFVFWAGITLTLKCSLTRIYNVKVFALSIYMCM